MENKIEYQLTTSMHEGIIEIVITGEATQNTVEKLPRELGLRAEKG